MAKTASLPPSAATEMHQFWGRIFGDGYVPQDVNRLRAMAAAIEMRYDRIATLALLCQHAWER